MLKTGVSARGKRRVQVSCPGRIPPGATLDRADGHARARRGIPQRETSSERVEQLLADSV
jgi:hypothetical protein